jgi:hypothetical protein
MIKSSLRHFRVVEKWVTGGQSPLFDSQPAGIASMPVVYAGPSGAQAAEANLMEIF